MGELGREEEEVELPSMTLEDLEREESTGIWWKAAEFRGNWHITALTAGNLCFSWSN